MSTIKTTGAKRNTWVNKDLLPGAVKARICGLSVEKVEKPRDPKVPEYNIWIDLVGEKPSEDFVGKPKNFTEPDGKKWDGPHKKIKHGTWPIKAFSWKKDGKTYDVDAESQIVGVLQEIAEAMGQPDLLDSKEYEPGFKTWSDLIKKMNMDLQFSKNYLYFLLGGTQTQNDKGYDVYFLNLPEKKTCGQKPRIAATLEELAVYNAEKHLYIKNNPNAKPQGKEDGEFNNTDEDADAAFDDATDEDLFEGATDFDTEDDDIAF